MATTEPSRRYIRRVLVVPRRRSPRGALLRARSGSARCIERLRQVDVIVDDAESGHETSSATPGCHRSSPWRPGRRPTIGPTRKVRAQASIAAVSGGARLLLEGAAAGGRALPGAGVGKLGPT